MYRKIILFPAVLTTAFALTSIFFGIADPDQEAGQFSIRLVAALFIFASAWLARAYAFRPSLSRKLETWLILSGWGLIALGGIGAMLTTFNGLRSGDFEYYLYLSNALFIVQGGLHLVAARRAQKAISS